MPDQQSSTCMRTRGRLSVQASQTTSVAILVPQAPRRGTPIIPSSSDPSLDMFSSVAGSSSSAS
eukprot:1934427-Lingulodinium_polyedra.AAC.1